jgi:2'-5' RNA ligase
MSERGESALVIRIPEAEALVESFRWQHDPSAALGVPAHITVLYPFKPPEELSPPVLGELKEVFANTPGFAVSFSEVSRFPDVLYLAPTPEEPLRHLTQMVARRYPETPPYGGRFADVIPHLTVAQVSDSDQLEAVARAFQPWAASKLPIWANVSEVTLMDNASGRWEVRARFPLGHAMNVE